MTDVKILELMAAKNYDEVRTIAKGLVDAGNMKAASKCFELLAIENPKDIFSRYMYAQSVKDGTHSGTALARDIALGILNDFPDVLQMTGNKDVAEVVRFAADQCRYVGPIERSVELYQKLVSISYDADDFYVLSELLATNNALDEAAINLKIAMMLNPGKYSGKDNNFSIEVIDQEKFIKPKLTIGRYPKKEDFLGDLKNLMLNHIAIDLKQSKKIINSRTNFFSMGSCFARHVAKNLLDAGYKCNHLEIAEHINTTFANKYFVEWLREKDYESNVTKRFKELLPEGWSRENLLLSLKQCDVFILTLGVAPAFFDRETGEYILPKPSELNNRVLADKYEFKNTSVIENLENVRYLIDFVRVLSPECSVVVTVSPIPLMASFNYKSCVVADCLSKSTMRIVAEELVQHSKYKDIYYWPSFEFFRWGGSSSSLFFGADDGNSIHASEDKVKVVIDSFIEIFKN